MLTIKRGDRYDIAFHIRDAVGVVDLTGATVRLLARHRQTGGPATLLTSVITDVTGGVVTHTLDGTLDALGMWDLEIEITDGLQITTAPTSGFIEIRTVNDLG